MRKIRLIILVAMIGGLTISTSAQEKCKVLKADIAGEYTGKCKKGLANGQGLSKGENIYNGVFKKGLPNGQGTMAYADGGKYEGRWKNGLKNGEGKYVFKLNGKDTIQDGIWKDDKFIGKKPAKTYKIVRQQSVSRYSIKKMGGNFDRVTVKVSNNGQALSNIRNITGSMGNRVDYQGYTVFENISVFPFTCEMRYSVPSKLNTVMIPVEFFFEIFERGDWLVEIQH